jgi:hypothetical protein
VAVVSEGDLAQRQYELGLLNRRLAMNVARLDEDFADLTRSRGSVDLLCACGREECDRPMVTVPLEAYDRVFESPHRFLIAPGHAAEIDEVIYVGERYEIVEIKPQFRSAHPLTAE